MDVRNNGLPLQSKYKAPPFIVAMLEFSRRSKPRSWRTTGQVSHTILGKAARLRLFGKHPAGFYLRLNRRIWGIIPAHLRNSYLIRAYGAWLQSLVRLVETRRQYFGTFFFRNRPALELMRRVADEKANGSTLRIAVLACSIGAEVGRRESQRLNFENCRACLQHRRRGLLNPLDHSFGATGPESHRVCGRYFKGNIGFCRKGHLHSRRL